MTARAGRRARRPVRNAPAAGGPGPMTGGPPGRIEGVILDVDGTLVDSNRLHAQAWFDAFTEAGLDGGTVADIQRLIGMGQDASAQGVLRGAQAALFDVSDLTDPRQVDLVRYDRGSIAAAGTDPRQFTWLPERQTALTVITEGWEGTTARVSVLEVSGDTLSHRMVEVEHGSDVAEVRLVPLPDGRVVLVTGDDVAFFDL